MPASPTDLYAYLAALDIPHQTYEHEATFTVDAGRHLKASMPGGHTKNLFMQDKDGTLVLISAWCDSQLRLNQLHKHIGTRRLSFASEARMIDVLGVRPGSVTAFALMNDTAAEVNFILDAALLEFDTLNFHPLLNTATTSIKLADFQRFVDATGHTVTTIDFTEL